jgi:hypothetical protein
MIRIFIAAEPIRAGEYVVPGDLAETVRVRQRGEACIVGIAATEALARGDVVDVMVSTFPQAEAMPADINTVLLIGQRKTRFNGVYRRVTALDIAPLPHVSPHFVFEAWFSAEERSTR